MSKKYKTLHETAKSVSSPNLNRCGRKTRTTVTAAEVDFCAYFVLTGNVKQASQRAGYSPWWGYELLKMPRVRPILREFERRKQEEGWETAKDQILLTRAFLDELFIQRLINMKTHPKVGDLAIAKMFETGYKRTGDIQPTRISAEAKADATSQLYAKRLYLPIWRKETIEEIQRAELESLKTGLPWKTVSSADVFERLRRKEAQSESPGKDVSTADRNPNDPQLN